MVISVRHGSRPSVEEILKRWNRVPAAWRTDSSSLVYVPLDALVDGYGPLVDKLEDALRGTWQRLINPQYSNDHEFQSVFHLTDLVHASHAVVFPLEDVLNTLTHIGPPVVSPQGVPYFRDVRNHAVPTVERLDLARSLADRAFDI